MTTTAQPLTDGTGVHGVMDEEPHTANKTKTEHIADLDSIADLDDSLADLKDASAALILMSLSSEDEYNGIRYLARHIRKHVEELDKAFQEGLAARTG